MKHNSYFEGAVQSLGFSDADGAATVGVITPGAYAFDTEKHEVVTVLRGALDVRLPGQSWRRVSTGEQYEAPAGCTFEVRADEEVPYLCEFGDAR